MCIRDSVRTHVKGEARPLLGRDVVACAQWMSWLTRGPSQTGGLRPSHTAPSPRRWLVRSLRNTSSAACRWRSGWGYLRLSLLLTTSSTTTRSAWLSDTAAEYTRRILTSIWRREDPQVSPGLSLR